jgi:hypothetical protein
MVHLKSVMKCGMGFQPVIMARQAGSLSHY